MLFNGKIVARLRVSDMNRVHASQFVPSVFMAQEPQTPSRHERRKVRVESTLFLIQIRTSRTIGPQSSRSTSSNRGAGSHLSPDCSDRSRMSSRVERRTAPATFARSQCAISGGTPRFRGTGNRLKSVRRGIWSDERMMT